jgi:hypothetical protein
LRKLQFSAVLAASLATLVGVFPAKAETSQVDYVQLSDAQWHAAFDAPVKWNKKSVALAEMVIARQVKQLKKAEDGLRTKGATKIHVQWVHEKVQVSPRVQIDPALRRYQLVGFNDAGEKVESTEALPISPMDLAARAVKPSANDFLLKGFSIFDPSTWSAKPCRIAKPTPLEFLGLSLKAKVAFSNPYDSMGMVIGMLGSYPSNAVMTVTDGRIACLSNCGQAMAFTVPQTFAAPLGGYTISMTQQPLRFKVVATLPNVQQLARGAILGYDGTFIAFK